LQAPRSARSSRRFRTSRGTQGGFADKRPDLPGGTSANRQGAWRRGKPSRGGPVALGCSVGAVSVLPSGRWALATWRLDQYCRGGHRAQSLTPLSIRMRMGDDLARLCLESSSARVRVWVAVGWHTTKTLPPAKRFAPRPSSATCWRAGGTPHQRLGESGGWLFFSQPTLVFVRALNSAAAPTKAAAECQTPGRSRWHSLPSGSRRSPRAAIPRAASAPRPGAPSNADAIAAD
jgi:hypothetical protein